MKPQKDIIFSTYVTSKADRSKDLLVVKEHIATSDGAFVNNLRFVENYQRSYSITKPEYRDHEQKKEYEHLSKVDTFTSTQVNLSKAVFEKINGFKPRDWVNPREMNKSPYVYGTDASSAVLLNLEYKRMYPDYNTPSTMAVLDTETDMLNGTGRIICSTISSKEKVHLSVTKDFLGPESYYVGGWDKQIRTIVDKYLGDILKKRNVKLEITIVDNDGEVAKNMLRSAHSWQPDFLTFWNMPFDIEKILLAFEKNDMDPAFYFSDPSVPSEYKYFNWRKDKPNKETADGKKTQKHMADLWHTLTAPASFYCIDKMCLFKRVRGRDQMRNSYSLDNILHDELGVRKLKFKEADAYTHAEWHVFMQTHYKLEYLAYNIFDCIGVELLDEKNGDVSSALRDTLGISELSRMASNPKRLSDDMGVELEEDNKVIGSTSPDMSDEYDKHTPSKDGWIITLAAELTTGTGLYILDGYPNLSTNISAYAFDIDIRSSYPTTEIVCNVSKGTRNIETCGIKGLTHEEVKSLGVNLSGLTSNALIIAQKGYGFPDLDSLLESF